MVERKRAVLKAVTWRPVAMITSIVLILIFFGQVKLALGYVVVETAVKMSLHYAHERLWLKSRFGLDKDDSGG